MTENAVSKAKQNQGANRGLAVVWSLVSVALFTLVAIRLVQVTRASVSVEGTVVASVESKMGRAVDGVNYCSTYEFTHKGRAFRQTSTTCYADPDLIGKKTALRIDPNDPNNWYIDRFSALYGMVIALSAVGLLALFGAVTGFRKWRAASREPKSEIE